MGAIELVAKLSLLEPKNRAVVSAAVEKLRARQVDGATAFEVASHKQMIETLDGWMSGTEESFEIVKPIWNKGSGN